MKRPRLLPEAPLWILLTLFVSAGCGGPLARVDAQLFPRPERDSLTFWGHACIYIDVGGYGIVTDPVFEKQLIVRRRKVPAPPPESYAHARLILLSHAHNDHLSLETLATFPETATILCPEPVARYLTDLKLNVEIMRPGDVHSFPGGRITAVTAYHTGGRWAIIPVPDGRALGYVIETPTQTLYYSGDSDFFDGFAEVAQDHRPDIALLNINGSHLSWKEAVDAARILQAPTVVPMHFGAFGYLIIGRQKQPRGYSKAERELGDMLHFLDLGESMALDPVQEAKMP